MSLSYWAVKYKPIVISAIVLAMTWGVVAFFTMPRREDPQFTIRVCVVSTSWPGAPAETVEELVTDKLETKLISIEDVKLTRSITRNGQSTVFVELEDWVSPNEIQDVWDKVRARVQLVEMPDPDVRPIVNDEFGDTTVLLLAVYQTPTHERSEVRTADRYSDRELEEFAELVQDELRLLHGVGKVDLFGVREEAVYIETDLGNWSQLSLTTDQLEKLAKDRNIIEPGGEIDTRSGRYLVKPGGEFNAVSEIEHIASIVRAGDDENSVMLSDLGLTVTRDLEDPASYLCRFGDAQISEPAVMVALTMKSGSNIIDICDRAKQRVHELVNLEQRLPADIAVTPVSDQSENVAAKINNVVINVLQAIAIVVIVVYLVVGFRTSFVMAANIPVVVISSVGIISALGVELEQISLAALIISLGLLVDNAVQVCDQARTNQIAGMKPFTAAIEGANTLAVPMLVGTLTTMAAFIPMLFALQGGGKEYIYSLPITVSTTLAISWILAMTFCVILAGLVIRVPKDDRPASPVVALFHRVLPKRFLAMISGEPVFFRLYGGVGSLAVRFKWMTVWISAFALVGILALPVSSEFFPDAARDQFAVKIMLPETATIDDTDRVAKQVESILRRLDADSETGASRLRAMRTMVGGGGSRWHLGWDPEPQSRNFAEILVRTHDGRMTNDYAQQLREACELGNAELGIDPVVGARIVPVKLALGPPADPLVLRVIGNGFADPKTLRSISNRIKTIVRNQPETWDVADSWGVSGYQIQVDVNQEQAVLAGVTNAQVAKTLNSYYSGLRLTTFREGDHQVPVYFRLTPEQRLSISGLREAYVEGDHGKIPLASLAEFNRSFEHSRIDRRDMNRVIEISAQMEPGVTGNDVVTRVLNSEAMAELVEQLPPGFRVEPGGSFEESARAGGQMLNSFGISFVLILLCLICQYSGWSKPFVILTTLPFALAGANLGLYLSGLSLGFMPQLGILALFGIVLNTAIIYFEFADQLIQQRAEACDGSGPIQGLTRKEFRDCLVEAGKQRMLPIFLTTATTVGGLLPLALSGGPLWEGLAWCMIVGLVMTTVLTLIIVPAMYAILVETFGVHPIPDRESFAKE
ncbi:MAG: efflux RND transporter permease subunit [Rubripirellula sp.]